jgi:hypothetical protein
MVDIISDVMHKYQDKLREVTFVTKCFFKRDCFGSKGDVNKIFLTFLFFDHATGLHAASSQQRVVFLQLLFSTRRYTFAFK